jgi:GNAT superfamily N-acetyltransferase
VSDSHLSQLLELYAAEHRSGTFPYLKSSTQLTSLLSHALHTVIAVSSSSSSPPLVVGFAVVTGARADPLLEDVIVREGWRGAGLGSQLVEEAVRCGLAEAERIDLYCAWAVRPFYSRLHFALVRGEEGGRCLMRRTGETTTTTEEAAVSSHNAG